MKKSTIICLILAVLLVAAGLGLFTVAMTALNWDFSNLSTVRYETNIHEVSEAFTNIAIDTETADIVFLPSPDGKCRVECYEQENMSHSVTVQDGTLTVCLMDGSTPEGFIPHIGINFDIPKVMVYLPATQYAALSLHATTGDVTVPKDFSFDSADISMTTGQIDFSASAAGLVKLQTTTGNIRTTATAVGTLELSVTTGEITVSDVTCRGTVTADVSTGDANITNLRCENLLSQGRTGDITMKNVIASDSFSIQRTTGDITFDRCDASEIFFRTSTGDVRGSLLSEKVFIAQTDTGHVTVPRVGSGGMCQIDTTTGDIYITLVR